MKFLPLLLLVLIPMPVSAITWNEFWRPFKYDRTYYPYYRREYVPVCTQQVYREEYVPGTYWNPGYTRRWTEVVRVPCSY
jgi:hypothetical protein